MQGRIITVRVNHHPLISYQGSTDWLVQHQRFTTRPKRQVFPLFVMTDTGKHIKDYYDYLLERFKPRSYEEFLSVKRYMHFCTMIAELYQLNHLTNQSKSVDHGSNMWMAQMCMQSDRNKMSAVQGQRQNSQTYSKTNPKSKGSKEREDKNDS